MGYPSLLFLLILVSCAPATDGERAVIACQEKLRNQAKLQDKLKSCQSDNEFWQHLHNLESDYPEEDSYGPQE